MLSFGPALADRLARAAALRNNGDAAAADALLEGALRQLRSSEPFHGLTNVAIDVLISLGRYRDALSLEPPIVPRRDAQWILIQANLAEAEYCQGQWQQAQARLSSSGVDGADTLGPVAKSSIALQRAWLAVQLGDARTALAQVASVSPADCPRSYRAEWFFTSAAAHSLAGNVREADAAVDKGAQISLRSSSERNALALRGALLRARSMPREAERWLSRAAAHRWRGQSGFVLLAWGDVLAELGRHAEARTAWSRIARQDPESEAARDASQRTSAPTGSQ